ncbi:MAG: hypothetical protein ACFFCS_28540 [Candidatus Hodarchaeota archaeon]
MSEDPARVHMKAAIRTTLIQFDALSKQIQEGKSASSGNPREKDSLYHELSMLQKQQDKLMEDFENFENVARKMIEENPEKNKKKIKKMFDQLQEKITENNKYVKMIEGIQEKLNRMSSGTTDADLKEQYKTSYEIIQDFHKNLPDLYAEVEQETGIYFFTTPKI